MSYTSANPQAASTLLNLMWTDEFVLNAMMYGVEGRDWVRQPNGSITYPEGVTMDSAAYSCWPNSGIFGDEFLMYLWGNATQESLEYERTNLENARVTPLFGFTPSAGDVSAEIAACSNIYNQYHAAMVYGDLDPDTVQTEFVTALQTAGWATVVSPIYAPMAKPSRAPRRRSLSPYGAGNPIDPGGSP